MPVVPLIDQLIFYQCHVRWNPHQLHLNSFLAEAPAQLLTFIQQKVFFFGNDTPVGALVNF
jgi:hypothetical protein